VPSNKNFRIFNTSVWVAIFLLLAQQLIVASSTIWLTRLILHIQLGSFNLLFLGLYLVSLFLPYFPGAGALIEMSKAKVRANVDYVDRFAEIYRGQIVEWGNRASQSSKSAILTVEAPQTLNSFIDYIYHLASTSLNVSLNLLTLAILVEPLLILSYGAGIFLAFLILKLQKRNKKILALKAQQGRIKWLGMLAKAWDNVLLNNHYNFSIWQKKSHKRARRLVKSAVKLQGFSQTVSVLMAFVLLMPSFGLVTYLLIKRSQDLAWVAMLVVTLPRLFQVLSYSYEMLLVLSDFPQEKSRLNTILKILNVNASSHRELEKRIQWDKISATYPHSLKQLLHSLPEKGRITLFGENGSGKTSLLLLLKHLKGDAAFYLPAKHDLVFQVSKDRLSTGQNVRKTLHEIIQNLNTPIVLLDEWDANLDNENALSLSCMIDKLALNACVVESRHARR
jgi:ABC-type bacteriocin/lantibiotic exporter with double-glycine peptidase domain